MISALPVFHASGGGEAGWVSGCHDGVGPAGGRGVMQGVGGDSSVSHCTQGVTLTRLKVRGRERERERDTETERGREWTGSQRKR